MHFVVEFKKDIDERGMQYSWSTLPAELNVLAGLDNNISIDEGDISLYRSLLYSIQSTDRRVAEMMQRLSQISNSDEKIESLKTQLNELIENLNILQNNIAYLGEKVEALESIEFIPITEEQINGLFDSSDDPDN